MRHARLLAVHPAGAPRVFQGPEGRFYQGFETRAPRYCDARGVDCAGLVAASDDREYASRTDGEDLGAREEVLLRFDGGEGNFGIALGARNSFVTTYVFYQSLAYAGTETGPLLASLERGEPGVRERVLGIAEALGGIEIFVRRGGTDWVRIGEFDEPGPIATDRIVFPFTTAPADSLEVKLRMARGSWRVDWVALVDLGDVLDPAPLPPDSVIAIAGGHGEAVDRLHDPGAHLVTAPGDAYRLWYTIPQGGPYELFLDTQGFYYEWMRSEWLQEEDPAATGILLLEPERALRQLAPLFKRHEEDMERLFWASRFRR